MGVNMGHAADAKPASQYTSFHEVGNVFEGPAVGSQSELESGDECSEEQRGATNQRPQAGPEDLYERSLEDIPRLDELLGVARIQRFGLVSTHCDTNDLHTRFLESQDLPSDEGVTDLRILIYQIGDTHRRSYPPAARHPKAPKP